MGRMARIGRDADGKTVTEAADGGRRRVKRTTLGDVEELLRMNVLHPAGIVVAEGIVEVRVSWDVGAAVTTNCWRNRVGGKSSRARRT